MFRKASEMYGEREVTIEARGARREERPAVCHLIDAAFNAESRGPSLAEPCVPVGNSHLDPHDRPRNTRVLLANGEIVSTVHVAERETYARAARVRFGFMAMAATHPAHRRRGDCRRRQRRERPLVGPERRVQASSAPNDTGPTNAQQGPVVSQPLGTRKWHPVSPLDQGRPCDCSLARNGACGCLAAAVVAQHSSSHGSAEWSKSHRSLPDGRPSHGGTSTLCDSAKDQWASPPRSGTADRCGVPRRPTRSRP